MCKEKPVADLSAAACRRVEEVTGKPLAKAQADFVSCLFPALIASVPTFLQAFMSCMAGGSKSYDPGDRERCS